MRIAFLIQRRNYYRLLGPVVERALARGWQTECWENSREPLKGRRELERRDTRPAFRHDGLRLRGYAGDADLTRVLTEGSPDVVATLRPPAGVAPNGPVRWLGLQYTLDIGAMVDAAGRPLFDAMGVHTEHWRSRTADALRIIEFNRARSLGRPPETVDDAAVEATMRRHASVVGFPEMDQFHAIDPAAVRRRLGLDATVPIVVCCPFPFRSNPRTAWVRHVYGAGPLHQRLAVRLGGKHYARHVAHGWDDRGVTRAIRGFCDANGAVLLVKARPKDPVPAYLARAADRVLYEQTDYPATILELMSVASLCLHFFSTVAYEAAYAGVPSICVTADGDDLGFPPIWREWFLSAEPGSSFNFPGVTYPLSVEQMVADFPRRRLTDFPLEPAARAHYLEKFVGSDDGKASDRLLDLAASLGACQDIEGDHGLAGAPRAIRGLEATSGPPAKPEIGGRAR